MSGYRVMAGMGRLKRAPSDKPDDLPANVNGKVYDKTSTKEAPTDCLHQLTHRIGAGVTMTISRTRNNNYIQEMGLREFSTATSGMYEVDFSFEGVFAPKLCENWLGYVFMMGDGNEMKPFEIKSPTSSLKVYTDPAYTSILAMTGDQVSVYGKLVVSKGDTFITSSFSTASFAYNSVAKTEYKYYTDAECEKEYLGSNKTQEVYVKATLTFNDKSVSPLSLVTTEAVTYATALADGKVRYYVGNTASSKEYTPTLMDTTVYIENNGVKFGQPILLKDLMNYREYVDKNPNRVVKLFGYTNLTGPKYFDMGYQKINAHASGVTVYDGLNELGVLVGCAINSASMSYESGSDAGIKFSISGHALRDIVQMTSEQFDYASILDPVPTEVFVGGCVSVYDKDTDSYHAVAQTDSASLSISNNLQKLGNCLKLNYSSYAMGSLTYEVSTSTYSNDPNKYLKYLYGYTDNFIDGKNYFIAKAPKPIDNMKIRTDDTSATKTEADIFMDINLIGTYVGDMSSSYSVDRAIMDEPSLRPKKVYVAVGYQNE